MKKQVVAGIAAIALGAVALAGCGSPSADPTAQQEDLAMQTELSWLNSSAEAQISICKRFRESPELVKAGFDETYHGVYYEEWSKAEAWQAMEAKLQAECYS